MQANSYHLQSHGPQAPHPPRAAEMHFLALQWWYLTFTDTRVSHRTIFHKQLKSTHLQQPQEGDPVVVRMTGKRSPGADTPEANPLRPL
jgi:hypothetical protein